MARNEFENPSNGNKYAWDINHSEEEEVSKERAISHGGNTADTGLVRQQSDDQPLVFRYSGTILKKSQLEQFIDWFQLCKTQTIYFHDFTGDSFEVIINSFKPLRRRTIKNPRDFANAPLWYWTYQIEIEVVRVIDGVWA